MPVAEIAPLQQRHRSTIYRELRRGAVTNKNSEWAEYRVCRAQRAQDDYIRNSGTGGPYLILSWDSVKAKRLHDLMTINKMSPYAAIEKRPIEINERDEVGHREMELVVGARGAKLLREFFRIITCDNDSEFLDFQSLERPLFNNQAEQNFITRIHFPHLNEEATKTQTV